MSRRRPRGRAATRPQVERPINWVRLRQVFGNLSHRRTKLFSGHVFGPVVEALTPQALIEKTGEWFADAVRGLPEN